MERLHRTLFDQLRAVRLQWALSLGIHPERLPQQSLPWLLQHSVFILNKYLVKDTGTTAHQSNYHKTYNNPPQSQRIFKGFFTLRFLFLRLFFETSKIPFKTSTTWTFLRLFLPRKVKGKKSPETMLWADQEVISVAIWLSLCDLK